ncbi:MAG: FG-GAP-like repeat-containing protein [Desulfobacterales bacterium]
METTRKETLNRFLISLMLLVMILGSSQSAVAKVNRVAIVPFKINAEKDLSFLRDGIVDMLTSRLYVEGKVSVLCREEIANVLKTVSPPINESKAREIGTRLGVDYVLFGSLTVFGESVSMDARMVDVSGAKPVLTFFNQSQGMDEVIPKINLFATDINEKVFGRAMPSQKAVVTPLPQTPQTQPPQDQIDVRMHPEKLMTGGFQGVDTQGPQQPAPGLGFLATQEARSQSAQFWASRSIRHRINGISIGDIDGDGKQETVITTEHSVEAYRFDNNHFLKIKILADRGLDNLIGVDVADINANGTPEIFITSLNPHRNMVDSFVLEFDGQTYTEIVTHSRWYYRVVDHPLRGHILLGQQQDGDTPFSGQVYEMVWENKDYAPVNEIPHGRRTHVLGLTYGDALNEDVDVAVAYDNLDYLRIFSVAGKERWKDGEHSGGGAEYYIVPHSTSEYEEKEYYPVRIIIRDFTENGKNEVITVKNHRFSELISYRKFTHGEIQIRSWNAVALGVLWRTRKLKGYFSDVAIGDFNNDGNEEVVAPLVIKTGYVVGTKPKSKVIAYPLK